MKTLYKKAGVKYFRYHALCHLGATVPDSANVKIGSIQRLPGHENQTTTEIYLHSINESEREAIKDISLTVPSPKEFIKHLQLTTNLNLFR